MRWLNEPLWPPKTAPVGPIVRVNHAQHPEGSVRGERTGQRVVTLWESPTKSSLVGVWQCRWLIGRTVRPARNEMPDQRVIQVVLEERFLGRFLIPSLISFYEFAIRNSKGRALGSLYQWDLPCPSGADSAFS